MLKTDPDLLELPPRTPAATTPPASTLPPWLAMPEPHGFRPKRRYRTVWISDIHLGTRGCNAAL